MKNRMKRMNLRARLRLREEVRNRMRERQIYLISDLDYVCKLFLLIDYSSPLNL